MYNDLRELLEKADELGLVKKIEGADWDLEIGTITELAQSKPDMPLLLFDNIKGNPPGYRVVTNILNSFKLIALAYGLPLEARGVDLVKAWRKKNIADSTLHPPVTVEHGPVQENILLGDDIDLLKFPVPKWHEFDGGRYIGTGDIVITQDPDTGWVNMGVFRVQVHDKNTANVHLEPPRHTDIIRRKYWDRGQSCPVAVVCGGDPRLSSMSCQSSISKGESEYDYAGWLREKPVEVIKGKTVDLPIPAACEIVLEGQLVPPGIDDRLEGPFGEGKGYYDGGDIEPVMKVTCIMHRNAPIILGYPPLCGEYEFRQAVHIPTAATVWDELDRLIPEVKGVWFMNEARCPIMVVAIKQQYVGHAKETAIVALGALRKVLMPTRFIVIVDDDINPASFSEVMFAIGTRCNPEDSIDILSGFRCSPAETLVSPEKKRTGDISLGKCVIYACMPYAWINDFPRSQKRNVELMEEAVKKWGHHLFSH